jgi:8-oxo-dGTP pyrophosphatase MutT (NUDIX family)
MKSTPNMVVQAGAIPFRTGTDGRIEVLLIRRLRKRSWGIPKGSIEPGQSAAEAAQQEAVEEAGAIGELSDAAVGRFTYEKTGKGGRRCLVHVYLLRVIEARERFPEQSKRCREWFPVNKAAALVRREAVGALIRSVPRHIRTGPGGRVHFVSSGVRRRREEAFAVSK